MVAPAAQAVTEFLYQCFAQRLAQSKSPIHVLCGCHLTVLVQEEGGA